MITFILPTIGRPSLARALASIELLEGDEVIVIGAVGAKVQGAVRWVPAPRGHDWGSAERNVAMRLARGSHLAFLDDDDTCAPGHRAVQAAALAQAPDRPILFRMQYPDGRILWREPVITFGNVGTPMLLVPNDPTRLNPWGPSRWDEGIGNDLAFIAGLRWPVEAFVWRPEVICRIGDNVPAHAREVYV